MTNVHNSEVLIHLKNIERPDQDWLKNKRFTNNTFWHLFYVGA